MSCSAFAISSSLGEEPQEVTRNEERGRRKEITPIHIFDHLLLLVITI
jgi:hypothetical protein